MNTSTIASACNRLKLDEFLDGAVSHDDEADLVAHLDQCHECRDYLESHAAAPQTWNEAGVLLKREEFDDVVNEQSTQQPLMIKNVLDSLLPTDDPTMLGRLAGMEISGVVGVGAMGVVLKGFDVSLDRPVAIKVLAPHLASSGAARKRFAREARAAAAVLHPNVMAIHSVSTDEALPWFVMPYVRGRSLQNRLNDEGPLPVCDVLRIGSQIAAGLAAAHAQGLVHRDIKPANILLEDGVERVAITDFGLARAVDDASMTRSGIIAGTPQYMSPEQARGEVIDQRSDLFSLGSVLYAMCTGRIPFRSDSTFGLLRRVSDDQPTPIRNLNPDIPGWLATAIEKLMRKDPNARFSSASEVADLLEQCLAHIQQPDSAAIPEELLVKQTHPTGAWVRWRRWGWATLSSLAVLMLSFVIKLELNKGTLVIQCDADDVPIEIVHGEEVVESLTVTRKGTSLRIAAGEYRVRIDGEFDGLSIADSSVLVRRGEDYVVRISEKDKESRADIDRKPGSKNPGNALSSFEELSPETFGFDYAMSRAEVAAAAQRSRLTGYWQVERLGRMPKGMLTDARAVIDLESIYIRVPQMDGHGDHPHFRYTLKANGGMDLLDADTESDDEIYLAKYRFEGDLLYLAIRNEYDRKTRPVDPTGQVPEEEVLYVVLSGQHATATKSASPAQIEDRLIKGRVISTTVEGNLVQISIGSDDRIRQDSSLTVFRGQTFVGQLKVKSLSPDSCSAEVLMTREQDSVKTGDEVVLIPDADFNQDDRGHTIYNDRLRRFKFQLEKAVVTSVVDAGREFIVRYHINRKAPRVFAAWGDPKTNSIVIIGPAEADQSIRDTLAKWEGAAVGVRMDAGSPSLNGPRSVKNQALAAIEGHLQIYFRGPAGARLTNTGAPYSITLPERINLPTAVDTRIRIDNIPNSDSTVLSGTISLPGQSEQSSAWAYLQHNAIPVSLTQADVAQLTTGHSLTKVVYLPDPEHQSTAIAEVETLVASRLDPGVDPVAEADQRGTILAIVRLNSAVTEFQSPERPADELSGNPTKEGDSQP